jgi:transcriptional regulator with XRE-family HTH domain
MPKQTFQPDLKRLDNLRIKRGWTLQQLAAKAIVSVRTLNSIRQGKSVDLTTVSKLARAFGEPLESLLVGYSPEAPVETTTPRIEVQLKLSIPFEDFDEAEHLTSFIEALTKLIGAKGMVNIADVKDGSTIVTVDVEEDDMCRLIAAYLDGRLEPLDVTGILSPDIKRLPLKTRMHILSFSEKKETPKFKEMPKKRPKRRQKPPPAEPGETEWTEGESE